MIMKKSIPFLGILLVTAGALTLTASAFCGWTNTNGVQISALSMIVLGIIVYIAAIKRSGKY